MNRGKEKFEILRAEILGVSMKEKQKEQKRRRKRKGKAPLMFAAELLMLAILLAVASFAPQVIFQVQDSLLCDKITLGKRENMDVESLSITYEKSLGQRMRNFAEGLSAGRNYYITSQDLVINNEVQEYVNSEYGIYQEFIIIFSEIGWFIIERFDADMEPHINQWKQYVIYSDLYAKGVNFILWYIEVENVYGDVLKLLTDAETGTLYAVELERGLNQPETIIVNNSWNMEVSMSLWNFFSNYYETSSYNNIYEEFYKQMQEESKVYTYYEYERYIAGEEDTYELFLKDNVGFRNEKNLSSFYLPYGESCLEICLKLEYPFTDNNLNSNYSLSPNVTVGVRQIYEMIPEFA